jgi:hypothetical protein
MAISFVGSYASTHNAISAQAIAFSNLRDASNNTPTVLADDLVVVAYAHAMATTNTRTLAQCTPSGYTAAHASLITSNDSNAVAFAVSYKKMPGTPDTTVSIPAAAATTNGVAYAIFVFRGVDATTPLDVTTTVATAGNTGKANAPQITPSTPGSWIVAAGGAAVAAGAVFTNAGDLSATTNHFRSATITTTTNDANVCMGIKTDWASGAFDPTVFGGSTTTNTGSWGAATLALRPVLDPATGSLAVQEAGADDFTASGTIPIAGSFAAQESGADDFTADGTVADSTITGSLAAQEGGADTLATSGLILVQGSLAAVETGTDDFTAVGTVAWPPVVGTLAALESGADAFSGSGAVAVVGSFAVIESGADVLAASGSIAVQGSLAVTEAGEDDFTASGLIIVQGSFSASEVGSDVFAASGMIPIQGTAAAVEIGSDDFTGLGALAILGAFAAVETGSDSFSAAGSTTGGVSGSFSAVETGSDDFTASGQILLSGALTASEVGLDGFAGTGTVSDPELDEIIGFLDAAEVGQDQFSGSSGGVAHGLPSTTTIVAREIGRVTVIPRSG